MYAIVDIDNCISHDAWRRCLIPQGDMAEGFLRMFDRYHAYHSCSEFDKPDINMCQRLWGSYHSVIVFTARPSVYMAKTQKWLQRIAGLKVEMLLMRDPDDERSSVDVKRDMLSRMLKVNGLEKSDIAFAVDDRIDIVNMYNEEGVFAFQYSLDALKDAR